MSSQHVRPLLSAYIDGEATAAERRQVDEHLVRCADCAAVLAEYRAIGSNVRAMPRPVPPPTLHRDVWTAIEANRGRSTWGANLAGLLRWGALGATALAALVILVIVWPKTPPAAGVQMTRPVNGQTNVGINSPVILQFSPPVLEQTLTQVGTNQPSDTVYARWLDPGTALELGPSYPTGLTPGPDTPPPAWPSQSVITISVAGPVYAADGKTVIIGGTEIKRFTFTTGTLLDPTDTVTPVPTDTPTPEPPTATPEPPTPEPLPTDTPFVPPQETATAAVPPTQPPPPPVFETETPAPEPPTRQSTVPEPPTRQPTVPAPPTVTTQPGEPTKEPTLAPPSLTPIPPPLPTPPSVTPIPPSATPLPTATPLPPTNTPVPTPSLSTPGLPSPQPTAHSGTPTEIPKETPGPEVPGTPTLIPLSGTPRVPTTTPATTPTVAAGCPVMPQHGFGQVYSDPDHAALRAALGCPNAVESGFDNAAEQNFEHGYIFWNGDAKRIYVFSAVTNAWRSYADTWVDGEPPPVVLTPPAGYFQPVRGFGKVWVEYPEVRQALGWATGQEHGITAAWQSFTHGAMLWTNSHIIRVLYDNGGWELYYDTYTGP